MNRLIWMTLSKRIVEKEDKTFTVPEGSYFMLGDNREISLDARYWKHTYITTDDMKSKEILIIPFHRLPWF